MEIRLVEAALVPADWQKEVTKQTGAFRDYASAPKVSVPTSQRSVTLPGQHVVVLTNTC
jgi:hypothetical protein